MKKGKFIVWCAGIIGLAIAGMAACDIAVSRYADGRTFDSVDEIPHRKVGLILGASPVSMWTGLRNYYFDKRIETGADLYKAGKVDWLLVAQSRPRGSGARETLHGHGPRHPARLQRIKTMCVDGLWQLSNRYGDVPRGYNGSTVCSIKRRCSI